MPRTEPSQVEPDDEFEAVDEFEAEPAEAVDVDEEELEDVTEEGWDATLTPEEDVDEEVLVVPDDEDEADEEEEEDEEALDELESEELEMLTDDEASETLVVDEVAELRAIRRAELALDEEGGVGRAADEFQCQSCFLVLKKSQLADKRRAYCVDCAS